MNSSAAVSKFDVYLRAVGHAIREIRKEQGISQEELALRASIDRSHMGKIERGERNVTVVNVLRISGALHCTPSELLRRSGF